VPFKELKMKYKIEKFNINDLDELHSLIVHTIKSCYFEYYPKEAIEYFISYTSKEGIEKDSADGYIIVIRNENEIIGTGTLINTHIKRVFVNPTYQGKGYGKIIMNELEEQAKKNGYKIVEIHSSLFAKKFYDSIGYKMFKIGKIKVENNEILYYQRMAKALINANSETKFNFNNKRFRVVRNDGASAEVNEQTVFNFYQNKELIYAEYSGGNVKSGEIFGIIENNKIYFYYEQENINNVKSSGKSIDSINVWGNNKLQLIDEWEWSSKKGKGVCVLEEI